MVLLCVYVVADVVPRLTAYSDMTPAQKAFYQSLEVREFTTEQKSKGVDIFAEFIDAYDLEILTNLEIVEQLLKHGFWVQGGGVDGGWTVSEDGIYGGFLRKQIYPGIKGQVLGGDVFVGVWRRPDGESGINAEVIFLTRFF